MTKVSSLSEKAVPPVPRNTLPTNCRVPSQFPGWFGSLSRALIYGPGLALAWVFLLLLFEIFWSRRAGYRYVCPTDAPRFEVRRLSRLL